MPYPLLLGPILRCILISHWAKLHEHLPLLTVIAFRRCGQTINILGSYGPQD